MRETKTPEEQHEVPASCLDARDTPSIEGGAGTHLSLFEFMTSALRELETQWSVKVCSVDVQDECPYSFGFDK